MKKRIVMDKFELRDLVLSGVDTETLDCSLITDSSEMFSECSSLSEVKVELPNCTDARWMFSECSSLSDVIINCKKGNFCDIDGFTVELLTSKTIDDFKIHKALIFPKNEKCFIAQRGNYYAHGETIKEAINDVQFKFMQNEMNLYRR